MNYAYKRQCIVGGIFCLLIGVVFWGIYRATRPAPLCTDAVSYTHLTLPTTPYV